jgi:peptide/nickel transport system ATP-binding protein
MASKLPLRTRFDVLEPWTIERLRPSLRNHGGLAMREVETEMLRATEIRFRYESHGPWVLDRVSLGVEPGEIVGLSGRSGTGKSTLARILSGYLQPLAGAVEIDDDALPTSGYCPIQLVFQNPEMAVNPFFRMSRALSEGGHGKEELSELSRVFGIEAAWLSRFSYELSGGELQRIALARATGRGCRYLIVDEATAMLDPISQVQIWTGIRRIVDDRKIGVLAISHDAPLLRRVAHRVVNLSGCTG